MLIVSHQQLGGVLYDGDFSGVFGQKQASSSCLFQKRCPGKGEQDRAGESNRWPQSLLPGEIGLSSLLLPQSGAEGVSLLGVTFPREGDSVTGQRLSAAA